MRKWPTINILDLYVKSDTTTWNEFLAGCLKRKDTITLAKTIYGIQIGMDDLAKKKLNSEKICVWYTRVYMSLEQTAKKIFKEVYPSPLDNTDNASKSKVYTPQKYKDDLIIKRKRDAAFNDWVKRSSF